MGIHLIRKKALGETRAQLRVLAALQDFGASGLMVHKIRGVGPGFEKLLGGLPLPWWNKNLFQKHFLGWRAEAKDSCLERGGGSVCN